MQVFYKVVIQMRGTYETDGHTMELAAHHLGFSKRNIDEQEIHNATIFFYSNFIKPTEMRDRVLRLLAECRYIYYVDVVYRFEHELVPDRFVVWQGGKIKEYTGKITFVEDGE